MKTKEQVEARIEKHQKDNYDASEKLINVFSDKHRELIQNEMFSRNRAIIELQWVLEG